MSEPKKFIRRKRELAIEKVTVTGIADKGKGVGRDEEGKVYFVEHVVPGDVVDVRIYKKKDSYFEGKPIHFHKYSDDRRAPFCEHFGICGGCNFQNMTYEAQLRSKEEVVTNSILRIGKVAVGEFLPIIPADFTEYYRNKLEFTFSNKRWLTPEEMTTDMSNLENVLGFHRPGAFDKIVHINHCYLQGDPCNELRNTIHDIGIEQNLTFFDLKSQKGFLRNVMIRVTTLGETFAIVSFHHEDEEKRKTFLDEVLKRVPSVTTLLYCINPKANDFILDLNIVTYFGKGYIEELLGDVRFRIGPRSFFQTNTRQAVKLFDVVTEFAAFEGTENVYDLYTGLGSIALYVAKKCKHVVGIEEIEAAIQDAKENALRNDLNNTTFYAGDVKNILTQEFAAQHGKPDILITDPPRAGMHESVTRMLIQLAAPKLIYVSCNPATQARDLQILSEIYDVKKVQPVDMFPHTYHIESVALLELKSK